MKLRADKFEQLLPATAISLNSNPGYYGVYITVTGASVRWRDDGTDPTTTVGHVIADGGYLEYHGDIRAIRFIQTAATATMNISYYRAD